MTGYEPADDEVPDYEQTIGESEQSGGRLLSTIRERAGNGTLALLAGGVMLARAVRAITESRGRAIVRAIAGAGLLAIGMRQRRSTGAPGTADLPDAGQPDVTFGEGTDEETTAPRSGTDIDIDVDESGEAGDGDEVGDAEAGTAETGEASGVGRGVPGEGTTGESDVDDEAAEDEVEDPGTVDEVDAETDDADEDPTDEDESA